MITGGSSFSAKTDYAPDPSIKCGECPCVSPCSPPPPTQPLPPTMVYVSPPPPQFVYEMGLTPPPPPGYVYETGAPAENVYPSDNPFDLSIYSNSSHSYSLRIGMFLMVVVMVSALQLLVFW
ncbi:hypothetical protein Salat_2468400 [Sesamum alatum]|uniref:Uncharacterized protein n=1 Tax=Sesamum alatum TaxID=300844 RepID=A0AAE1XRU2_9LAMI|nr:hypothetical protein Salat_2468400 [Sesamum alatum]